MEFRKCHFYSLLILDDARPIILAVITKQNVNSLLEREREKERDMGREMDVWKSEGARWEDRGKEETINRNLQHTQFLPQNPNKPFPKDSHRSKLSVLADMRQQQMLSSMFVP